MTVSRRSAANVRRDSNRAQHRKNRIAERFQITRPCPATGKQMFRSEKQAQVALDADRRAREAGNPKRQECRYYLCDACGLYHLTSQPDLTLLETA